MATRAGKKTTDDMIGKAGKKSKARIRHLNVNSGTANTGEERNRAWTEGNMTQDYDNGRESGLSNRGFKGTSTSSSRGRLAVQHYDENGNKTTVSTKDAVTHTFSDYQNGERKSGRKGALVNRRKRDYDVRVGLNNDQRSPEAIQRLRDAGLSDEEIGIGNAGTSWRISVG